MFSESIDSPAIAVCPRNPNTGKGWKENKSNEFLYYISFGPCKNEMTGENISKCIDNHTYSLGEVVKQTRVKEKILLDTEVWVELVDFLTLGKCFMLSIPTESLGFTMSEALIIDFNNTLDYYAMIVDPSFFLMTSNPRTMPRILLEIGVEAIF